MAIEPGALYPSQTDVDAVNYPRGKARNVASTGDGSGTPLSKEWLNDLFGMWQALLADAGTTPSGTPDTAVASQYLDAIKQACPNRIVYSGQITATGSFSPQTITGATTDLTYGAFTIPGLHANDVVSFSYNPIDVVNSSSVAPAYLDVGYSENGGGFLAEQEVIIPQGRTMTLTLNCQHTVGTPGDLILKLIGTGAAAGAVFNVLVRKFVSYVVIRP